MSHVCNSQCTPLMCFRPEAETDQPDLNLARLHYFITQLVLEAAAYVEVGYMNYAGPVEAQRKLDEELTHWVRRAEAVKQVAAALRLQGEGEDAYFQNLADKLEGKS